MLRLRKFCIGWSRTFLVIVSSQDSLPLPQVRLIVRYFSYFMRTHTHAHFISTIDSLNI